MSTEISPCTSASSNGFSPEIPNPSSIAHFLDTSHKPLNLYVRTFQMIRLYVSCCPMALFTCTRTVYSTTVNRSGCEEPKKTKTKSEAVRTYVGICTPSFAPLRRTPVFVNRQERIIFICFEYLFSHHDRNEVELFKKK